MKGSPIATWRYTAMPLVALVYPAWWLLRDGDAASGLAAAATGVGVTGVGTLLVWQLRDRWTHQAHFMSATAWSTVIAGGLLPTFLVTGWLPSRRPYRRPDLHVETWAGRLTIGLAVASSLFLMFWFLTSPRRGGGWLQKRLAKQWGHGLCETCGMAIYYGHDHPCTYCGAPPSSRSSTDID